MPQDYYFGRDGFGDFQGFEPINYTALVQPKHAVNAIIDIVNERPGIKYTTKSVSIFFWLFESAQKKFKIAKT